MERFTIKNATKFTIRPIDSDKYIELDYLNNFKSETDEKVLPMNYECTIPITVKAENINELYDLANTFSCNISFKIEGVQYKVKLDNIASKYVVNCYELVVEYCKNIIYKLAEEGHKFVNGEVIDFQKYLV